MWKLLAALDTMPLHTRLLVQLVHIKYMHVRIFLLAGVSLLTARDTCCHVIGAWKGFLYIFQFYGVLVLTGKNPADLIVSINEVPDPAIREVLKEVGNNYHACKIFSSALLD